MKTVFALLITTFSINTWAADSSWLVCNDGKVVVNVFDHRAADGVNRETNLTLIYGQFVYQAVMSSDDPSSQPDKDGFQAIYINGPGEDQQFYTGTIKIDYSKNTMALKGQGFFGVSNPLKFDTTLPCREMDGH